MHKIVAEALERLLLMKFEETHQMEEEGKAVFQRLAHRPNRENLFEALSDDSCTDMLNQYTEFRDHDRTGDLWENCQDVDAVPGLCMDPPQIPKSNEGE